MERRGILVLIAASVGLAACGSTIQTRSAPPGTASTTIATTSTTAQDAAPALRYVGTGFWSENGTTLTERYLLGRVLYTRNGGVPQAALEACNQDFPTALATDAYVQGRITVSYTKGRVPTYVQIGGDTSGINQLGGGTTFDAVPAIKDMSGNWQCPATSADDGIVRVTMQPGGWVSLPVWYIFSDAVSNTQAALTAAEMNIMTPVINVVSDQFSYPWPDATWSGPTVATCQQHGGTYLFPFAKSKPDC